MSDVGEMWIAVRKERRERLDTIEPERMERFARLANHPDVIVLRRLGEYGYRLCHYDKPQSEYVDFWPRTSSVRVHDGQCFKGWVKLLRALGVRRGEWERPTPTDSPTKESR